MKLAIVHDSITEFGGAERMLQALLRIFPHAHVYTAFADPKTLRTYFPLLPRVNLHTSGLPAPFFSRHTSLFQSIAPRVWRRFDFAPYDLVFSHGSHLMSNLVHVERALHIQYIHSPPKNIFGLDAPTRWQKLTHYDRLVAPLYKSALRSTPYILTDSHHMRRILRRLFGVSAHVIYPPVIIPPRPTKQSKKHSYLCVSRIDRGKHLELAVAACTALALPLRIVGKTNEPRYEHYLRSIAGPTIQFLGERTDDDIADLYKEAIAFLFPSKNEDFGITPLEAMAHGVPVIAYSGGGAKETVRQGQTGQFFYTHSSRALARVLTSFDPTRYTPQILRAWAQRFSVGVFTKRLVSYLTAAQTTTVHQEKQFR